MPAPQVPVHALGLFRALLVVALSSLSAFAVDLTQVERRITVEPVYDTSAQQYCMLVFGPEARHRVWLVFDGDSLYVDRNGNGNLTEPDECLKAPDFTPTRHPFREKQRSIVVGNIAVGDQVHTAFTVSQIQYRREPDASNFAITDDRGDLASIWRQVPNGLVYKLSIELDAICYGRFKDLEGKRILHSTKPFPEPLAFAERADNAPIVHFGGPLVLRDASRGVLYRRPESTKMFVGLGTAGLGPGTFVNAGHELVPQGLQPAVTVEFPPRSQGEPPIAMTFVLEERC
ncbi:MAG: hypothetical protein L0Z55_11375 [Planctomycetes bacterium]|nr:hypothetical protein [Planctomycetota bacterium]